MSGYGEKYDVIVCGGGTSGFAAAIASARNGAKTLLIEKSGVLGGQLTLSGPPGFAYARLINIDNEQDTAGIVEETHQRLYRAGHALPHQRFPWRTGGGYSFSYFDPEWWVLMAFDMCEEAGVTLLLDTMVIGTLKDGDKVTGVKVQAVDGLHEIAANVVIDCTGEGYIAAEAGCEMVCVSRDDMQPHTICFTADGINWDRACDYIRRHPDEFTYDQVCVPGGKTTREQYREIYQNVTDPLELGEIMGYVTLRDMGIANGDWHHNSGVGFFLQPKEGRRLLAHFQHSSQVDHCLPTNAWDITRAHIELRKQIQIAWRFIKNYLPGFEDAYIIKIGNEIRFREGPRIVGDYVFTKEDVRKCRQFKDTIGKSSFPTGGYHTATTETLSVVENADGTSDLSDFAFPTKSYDIPYRILVPRKIENLLVAGKAVSTDRPAYLRYVQQTMVTGQAAGTAAALCARKGISPRRMEADENIKDLQDALLAQDVILFKCRKESTQYNDWRCRTIPE